LNPRLAKACIVGYAAIGVSIACWYFLLPGLTVVEDVVATPTSGAIHPAAWRLERVLTPKYERWARERVASTRAQSVATTDVAGTEWPLFGSVFYLWAMESLQHEYEKERSPIADSPAVRGRSAIDAATALVVDPGQAAWVKKYWGPQYLQKEDVFYRMMLIAAMTSHARLTGSTQYLAALRVQVESFSDELSRSTYGLLEDYPFQCYPADVLAAIAAVRAADEVLGTDHSDFVARSRRGFQGSQLDRLGLVPYFANSRIAGTNAPSRGCGNSFVSLRAPLVWPDLAEGWYDRYREHFWQDRWTAVGFREFPAGPASSNWHMDVDSGPVLAGHGIAASAFGVGAARLNGHFEDAYPLTLEMLATSWPLPDGTLAMPRLLSNAVDAPYLGEAAILYNLTRLPADGTKPHFGARKPQFVFLVLSLYFLAAALLIVSFVTQARHRWRVTKTASAQEAAAWVALLLGAIAAAYFGLIAVSLLLLLLMGRVPGAGVADSTAVEKGDGTRESSQPGNSAE
jgi:hypothetical protein